MRFFVILNFKYFRELHVATDKWPFESAVSTGFINGKTSASPVEILKHSIRRAWTINGTFDTRTLFISIKKSSFAIMFYCTFAHRSTHTLVSGKKVSRAAHIPEFTVPS